MDYIILDIEFNGRKFASDLPMEVIEIGAVRLNSALQATDEFSSLVKPVYFSKLNGFIKKKTGIPQEDIDQADGFRKVITDFMNWLNKSEAFLLVTWGGEDLKRIVYDTRMHKLDDAYWMAASYFDLLKGFIRYKNVTNDVSVEAALLDLNITAEGSAHRALDDARMTAEVFRAIITELDFERKQQYIDVYANAKERRLVKTAIRAMTAQKVTPTWELLVEHYFADKVSLTDPRKVTELQTLFAAELMKEKQVSTKAPIQ
ncbi:exonuclease domain-containing protein [Paenibacillus alginolyticus]|uniref:Exonuclease domain-containing protein n=1 Tax=Paenibacillus alginolyticus TaxID=59839 RepID=A0ABT4GNN5_9BACL|nr:3'-5' exonuclease [Paenibacillus alginolyticus]MCY9664593.1 exonuclease domain-containing protein [Paenibacillus alginolyticus]MCY9697828.1 exonuclease domain-containing protein [Paenibacillus alginolyticus]MEC0141906.1 exonuclease domain-containing protein [Paenibacillus alginolyticus]